MYLPHFQYTFTLNQRGIYKDLNVLTDDRWLHSTEIKYIIDERKGRRYLTMIYVFISNPLQLLCLRLGHYESLKKAEQYAKIFQRGIRRDARGTLTSNTHAFDICPN